MNQAVCVKEGTRLRRERSQPMVMNELVGTEPESKVCYCWSFMKAALRDRHDLQPWHWHIDAETLY